MLSQKNKLTYLTNCTKLFQPNTLCYNLYNALMDGKYRIFYKFNEIDESLSYYAYLIKEDKNLPRYIFLNIPATGELLKEFKDNEITHIFYIYIYNRELQMPKDELKKVYQNNLDALEELLKLDNKEIIKRANDRNEFKELIQSINEMQTNYDTMDKVEIRINDIYYYEYDGNYYLDISIGINRKHFYKVSIDDLIQRVSSESFYKYGKDLELYHKLTNFDDFSKSFIELIPSYLCYESNYYNKNSVFVKENGFFKILELYQEKKITFNQEDYFVNPIKDLLINIDIDGNMQTNFNINSENKILNEHFAIEFVNNEINLFEIDNPKKYKLLEFMCKNPTFNYSSIKKVFSKNLYPLIEDDVESNEDYKKNYSAKIKIKFYVDLNDNDELVLATEYLKNNKQIEKNEILNNSLYNNVLSAFDSALKQLTLIENGIISDQSVIVNFLKADLSPLYKAADLMLTENIKQNIRKMPKIRVNASYGMNWLNMQLSSDFSNEELNNIINAYKKKKKFYRYKKQFIIFDDEEETLNSIIELQNSFNLDKDFKNKKQIPIYQVLNLAAIGNKFDIKLDKVLEQIINDIKNFKEAIINLDEKFITKLRPYQLDAVKWLSVLRKYKLSGILGDDMGLGKTLEMISFISTIKEELPILIISPKSLIYNWENEFSKWQTNDEIKVIDGTKLERENEINNIKQDKKKAYVTSYDSLRNDIDLYKKYKYSLMILDEAQYIKNVYAKKTKAVKEIDSISRFVMTGTPIENSLSDLWSIFDFLMPNYLSDYHKFHSTIENKIISDGNEEIKKQLYLRIAPFILRRCKSDVLKELPPKEETIYTLSMDSSQRNLYDAYLEEARRQITLSDDKILIFKYLTRLRQLCIDPSMFIENFKDISTKLLTTLNIVKEAIENNHKLLIFSSFTTCLEHLISILNENNIPSLYIHGGVSAKKRTEYADIFNNTDDYKVICISLKAGGTGLNLVGADTVIHLDPWWNFAAENQATDRAHRIGQKKSVMVIKLICKNTIEEKVLKLQEIKKSLSQDFIPDNDSNLITLDAKDLDFLLS